MTHLILPKNGRLLTAVIFLICSYTASAQYDTVRTYYDNGAVKEIFPRYRKRTEGIGKAYYPGGAVKEERTYSAGKIEGMVKRYAENGKLTEVFSIENGKREGQYTLYDAEGVIVKDLFYVNGKIEQGDTLRIASDNTPAEVSTPPPAEAKTDSPPRVIPEKPATVAVVPAQDTLSPLLAKDTIYRDLTINNNPLLEKLSQIPEPKSGWGAFKAKIAYPDFAKQKKISGEVIISAWIDKSGDVTKTEIIRGLGYGFDDSAEIAVFYTKFVPAELNDTPVFSVVRFAVPFH